MDPEEQNQQESIHLFTWGYFTLLFFEKSLCCWEVWRAIKQNARVSEDTNKCVYLYKLQFVDSLLTDWSKWRTIIYLLMWTYLQLLHWNHFQTYKGNGEKGGKRKRKKHVNIILLLKTLIYKSMICMNRILLMKRYARHW